MLKCHFQMTVKMHIDYNTLWGGFRGGYFKSCEVRDLNIFCSDDFFIFGERNVWFILYYIKKTEKNVPPFTTICIKEHM